MQDERDLVLRIKDIDKSFGATHAVNHVSLDFYRGEVRGLIGENGSGKSTLTSMIAGFQQPDSGEMEKDGKPYRPATMLDGKRGGICILVQEVGTINGLTVAANLFLGNESQFATAGMVSQRRMQAAAREALERVGITDIDPAALVDTVSFEDRKLIEVAAAMNSDPDIIIFDETTTALSQKGRDKVYEIIRGMREANRTVIFISHDLQELESICDNISVLRDGRLIKTLENKDVSVEAMRSYMIGRELSGHYYREDETASCGDEVVLKAEHISWGGVLHDVSFELHRGEILGFGGLSECGMHELCKVAYGLITPDAGKVTLVRDNVEIKNPETAAAHGMAFIPKNREREAIMVSSSVRDNILLTSYDKVKSGPFIWGKREKQLATKMRDLLSIKLENVDSPVSSLSGGNKQKVVLAKWLANDSNLFIFDCPTRGIDIGVKASIYALMEELKAKGCAMIMVFEEMPELLGMSDRVLILRDGRAMGELSRGPDFTEENVIRMMI